MCFNEHFKKKNPCQKNLLYRHFTYLLGNRFNKTFLCIYSTACIALCLSLYLDRRNMPIPVWTRKKKFHIIRYPLHQVFSVRRLLENDLLYIVERPVQEFSRRDYALSMNPAKGPCSAPKCDLRKGRHYLRNILVYF